MSKRKYVRGYSEEYLNMGFIEAIHNKQLPMCLLCQKYFSNEAMKPSRLRDHLTTKHPEYVNKPNEYFQELRKKFINRPTMKSLIEKQCSKNKDGLLASYQMAKLIAKTGKNYGIGELLIIPCIKEFLGTVMHHETDILKTLPLSDTTVKNRIEEMANDVEKKTCNNLKKKTLFSIQLDESTIVDNKALLMVYVRYADENNVFLLSSTIYQVRALIDFENISFPTLLSKIKSLTIESEKLDILSTKIESEKEKKSRMWQNSLWYGRE